jgi:rod shape determining protein RodA
MILDDNRDSAARRTFSATARLLSALKLDGPLLVGLGLLAVYALVVQYSASGQSLETILRTLMRIGIGALAMIALAHSSPNFLRSLAPWLYFAGILLLLVVDAIGYVGKGAQRWLDLGLIRFQPSEIMKLAVPMLAASFMHDRRLPPDWRSLLVLAAIMMFPGRAGGNAARPRHRHADFCRRRARGADGGAPVAGHRRTRLRRRRRGLRRLAIPARLPAPAHPHFPRSAVRSAGFGLPHHPVADRDRLGRPVRQGLDERQPGAARLPSRALHGFHLRRDRRGVRVAGPVVLLLLYLFIVSRAVFLATQASGTFARLLASSLALTFFVYVFINAGMVTGLLPVVGVPLPLISYGGTSVVTLLAGFGILMGLYSHRKLVNS